MKDSELVRNAYRLILGREPESEAVLDMEFLDVYALRKQFMQSEEFQSRLKNDTYLNHVYRIDSFEAYDKFIEACKQCEEIGLDMRQTVWPHVQFEKESFFKLFGSVPPKCDPFSKKYANWEFAFFEFLSGRKYSLDNEGVLDISQFLEQPPNILYPLDVQIKYYQKYAGFLEVIRPKTGDRALEMGFGRGALLEVLGRCGCRVAGLDASPSFYEYTKNRLSSQHIEAELIQGPFFDINQISGVFDLVIFEASFHHCMDPVRLLGMVNKKLAIGGRVIFMSEPIDPSSDRPWGFVRYDGETLMVARKFGWLEYGFRTDFFEQLLNRTGFEVRAVHPQTNDAPMYEAVKVSD
ncbi:MAG TPA: hypothetical protein DEB31_09410 [Clostridiales bacterium]|nr:hypothetical protein [Clostridiales bacterium]